MEDFPLQEQEQRISRRQKVPLNLVNSSKYTIDFDEKLHKKIRNVVPQEHEWNSIYMLPRIAEFSNFFAHGVKIPWKSWFRSTFYQYKLKLYFNELTNYLLLVVTEKNHGNHKKCTDPLQATLPSTFLPLFDAAFTIGEKIKKLLLKFKSKPKLLITGQLMGGYVAQFMAYTITYCYVSKKGRVKLRKTPCEDFATYTVVFDSPPASNRIADIHTHGPHKDITLAVTNIINTDNAFYKMYHWLFFKDIVQIQFFHNKEVLFDPNVMTIKHKTSAGFVDWDGKEIPTSFFTVEILDRLQRYQFSAAMCPELVEKIPNFTLLDSYILIEDENVTLEEFFPRTHQFLLKFKDVIDSEIFADKHLKEVYEVLTENTRQDAHCLVMNEEGKRTVQQWPDGTVIRGCQSYKEMRFYACLYYNSIQNCYYCSYEKFVLLNAKTIIDFASKTKPTIILIVDDQNIQFQHQTYQNMKLFYLVLEPDVEKINNTLHFSMLDTESQNKLKVRKLFCFSNIVEAGKIFKSQLLQELRIFEIYNFRIEPGEHKEPFYVNHGISGKFSKENFESATALVNRLQNGEPKFVVICGEVGMGKSTTLKQIAYELQQKQQHFWIVNLDSSQIECQLTEAHTLDSEVSAVELIRNLEFDKLKDNKDVHMKLFEQKMKMNEMVLLIDSFDRISPKYRAEANNLIQQLRQTGLQIIVTTCPHGLTNFREEEIFELERFNNKVKKIKFIDRIYNTLNVPVPEDHAWLKQISSDVAKDSWNNPLSLVMAVYFYDTDAQLQAELTLELNFDFFKNVINSLDDSLKAKESHAVEKIVNCKHLFEKLAMCAVFHNRKIQDEYKDEVSEIGNFINSFVIAKLENDNKTVTFLHKPFANILVAGIFINQYKNEHQSPRLSIEQQKSVLMDKKHFEIRQNICGILRRSPKIKIADEVIQGNEKKLLQLLIEEDRLELYLNLKELLKDAHQNYVMKTSDSETINVLYLAMKTSSKKFVKHLLDDGAKFESVLQEEFVLHKAVENGLIREVRFHFDELKKDIDKADDRGNFPLHYAAQNKSVKMVDFLIANGANVNQANGSNQTALYLAIQAKHSWKLVDLLIMNNEDALLAFKWAAELGEEFFIVKSSVQFPYGDEFKEIHVQEALSSAAANGHLKFLQRLMIEFNAEPTALDEKGETSVHLAAAGGHLECVQELLKDVANVDVRNSKGETPLMKALFNDQEEVVEWLLENNADLQAEDAEGIKVTHHIAAFLLSKTMPTEELNDLKKVLKPISNSAKPLSL